MSVPPQPPPSNDIRDAHLSFVLVFIAKLPGVFNWARFIYHNLEGKFATFTFPWDVRVYLWLANVANMLSWIALVDAISQGWRNPVKTAKWTNIVVLVLALSIRVSSIAAEALLWRKSMVVPQLQSRDVSLRRVLLKRSCHGRLQQTEGHDRTHPDVRRLRFDLE